MNLPTTETLLLEQKDHALHITLNRPKARNAMSLQMVHELMAVFESIKDDRSVRAVVLRGADGHFCAGGDIKDMAGARAAASNADEQNDPYYNLNREFGRMLTQVNSAPQVVIAVTEGAVLGGGFGLVCVSDVAITAESAKFGLPETGLGIPPAQIAPFVVNRIGLTQTRRLALLGARFDGTEAARLGIVHTVCSDEDIEQELEAVLTQVKRCAPEANIITKALILSVGNDELDNVLDHAARSFSDCVQGKEGQEGTMAFIQKRRPNWA
ncbi:enoyl-CoA hydratase/isomerase family protein [Alkalimarinus alittae]|uniref:Enoyl-CoA hydratase-related protein n=1 Tax=Alkalimarinus alittae TaxID=2961619 RepID=A0ABY6MZX3_9ALTE|nr:enoyl-CoA hydratase-related protein [Alkalimarinus alittae]UZE95384.1 enoyl-CoA hydratase-related protein [Alkalimarinus alittae]